MLICHGVFFFTDTEGDDAKPEIGMEAAAAGVDDVSDRRRRSTDIKGVIKSQKTLRRRVDTLEQKMDRHFIELMEKLEDIKGWLKQ